MNEVEKIGPARVFAAQGELILASGSPRRQEMLAGLGLEFRALPGRLPEPDRDPAETPEAYALRAARSKALEAAARPGVAALGKAVVLAADTIVVLDDDILGKPRDAAEALAMLARLVGRTHRVVTGCALLELRQGATTRTRELAVSTEVDMHPWPQAALAAYAATGEPLDKAGAYGIQGKGGFLVQAVRGSYTNVVGLPLCRVLEMLVEWGAVAARGE